MKAFLILRKAERAKLIVPSPLGYGDKGAGDKISTEFNLGIRHSTARSKVMEFSNHSAFPTKPFLAKKYFKKQF
jgi:hypothetical protein